MTTFRKIALSAAAVTCAATAVWAAKEPLDEPCARPAMSAKRSGRDRILHNLYIAGALGTGSIVVNSLCTKNRAPRTSAELLVGYSSELE